MNDSRFTQSNLNWDLPRLVADLKKSRPAIRQKDYRLWDNGSNEPPSENVLVNIVKEMITALFPGQFGSSSLNDDTEDFFVSHKLLLH